MVKNLSERLSIIPSLSELYKINWENPEESEKFKKIIDKLKNEIISDINLILKYWDIFIKAIEKIKQNGIWIFKKNETVEFNEERKNQIMYAILKSEHVDECTKIFGIFWFSFSFSDLIVNSRLISKLNSLIPWLKDKIIKLDIWDKKYTDILSNLIFQEFKNYLFSV